MSERSNNENNNTKTTKSSHSAGSDNGIPKTILIPVLFGIVLAIYGLWKFLNTFIFTGVAEDGTPAPTTGIGPIAVLVCIFLVGAIFAYLEYRRGAKKSSSDNHQERHQDHNQE